MGEVAALITFVQFVSGFGFECQGGARKRAAGGRLRNFDITKLIIDGVCDQRVAAPLGVKVQILYNGHGEVERLFNAVFFIEPANERVVAVGGVDGCARYSRAMGNVVGIYRFAANYLLGQIGLDRVVLGRPFGVEYCIVVRHLCGIPSNGFRATGVCIPTCEYIASFFQNTGRITRLEVIARQRLIIRNCIAPYNNVGTVEFQLIAVAGVVEVVIITLHLI